MKSWDADWTMWREQLETEHPIITLWLRRRHQLYTFQDGYHWDRQWECQQFHRQCLLGSLIRPFPHNRAGMPPDLRRLASYSQGMEGEKLFLHYVMNGTVVDLENELHRRGEPSMRNLRRDPIMASSPITWITNSPRPSTIPPNHIICAWIRCHERLP